MIIEGNEKENRRQWNTTKETDRKDCGYRRIRSCIQRGI